MVAMWAFLSERLLWTRSWSRFGEFSTSCQLLHPNGLPECVHQLGPRLQHGPQFLGKIRSISPARRRLPTPLRLRTNSHSTPSTLRTPPPRFTRLQRAHTYTPSCRVTTPSSSLMGRLPQARHIPCPAHPRSRVSFPAPCATFLHSSAQHPRASTSYAAATLRYTTRRSMTCLRRAAGSPRVWRSKAAAQAARLFSVASERRS